LINTLETDDSLLPISDNGRTLEDTYKRLNMPEA
jgi:hypothetical protein